MRAQAVVMDELGDESVLRYREVEVREPGRDEVLVRVSATAVNHLDLELRDGRSRLPLVFPHVLGREVVGVVAALGAGVTGWAVDQPVVVLPHVPCGRCEHCLTGSANICLAGWMPGIHGWGGYAEYVTVPARGLVAAPELAATTTAAVPISFGTAWRSLHDVAHVRTGEWVLVPGAGGALGHAVVQLARLAGARVIGLVRSAAKEEFVRSCGAEHVVLTDDPDWPALVRSLTGGRGVDVVVEHVGGASFEGCVTALAPRGHLVVAGGHGGEHPRLDVIRTFRDELSFLGVRSQRPDDVRRVLDLAERGLVVPNVDTVLPLAEAADAHRLVESRTVMGKVVVVP